MEHFQTAGRAYSLGSASQFSTLHWAPLLLGGGSLFGSSRNSRGASEIKLARGLSNAGDSIMVDQEIIDSQLKADRFPFPSEGDITLRVRNANYALGPVMLHVVMNSGAVIPAHLHKGTD